MWMNGNTEPLHGNLFWLFRYVLIGIPPDYDDDVERRDTHPLFLPKTEAGGVIPRKILGY
jgi:hypothetical protein